MTACFEPDQSGALIYSDPQPADTSTCAYVVGSTAEFQGLANPFYSLSADEGALIAGAILALWAVGYAFRVLIQFLKSQ